MGGDDGLGRTLGAHLLAGLAERQGLGLGEEVRQEQLVHVRVPVAQRPRRVRKRDEVSGDHAGALVDQLVEGVLAVGTGLAPEDLAGLVGDRAAVAAHGLAVGLHGQLLQIRGEAMQVLRVGQDSVRVGTQEVRVPHVEQAHEQGHVLLGLGLDEMAVHRVKAGEEISEALGANRDGQGGADGRIHGVAPANPTPEAEGVGGVNAELGNLVQGGGHGDEVLGDRFLLRGLVGDDAALTQSVQQPGTHDLRVRDGLERREGLGGHDHEGRLGVQILRGLTRVGGINVGNEAALQALLHVGLESLVRHDGTQVGAADADVDDGLDGLAGNTGPLAGADAAREGVHLLQYLVHVGDHVLAVDRQGVGRGAAQRSVQDGAVFGHVDVLARKHAVAQVCHAGLLGEREQVAQQRGAHEVLRQVDVQVGGLEGELLRAFGIVRKHLAQIGFKGVGQLVELVPRGGHRRVDHGDITHWCS